MLMASTSWGEIAPVNHDYRLKNKDSVTLPGTRISLASSVHNEILSAEVSSILRTPFDTIVAALSQSNNWCQIMPLHFNIKACTYETLQDRDALTIYSGRKTYELPEDSFEMAYRFEIIRQDDSQLSLRLHADHGPLSTRDHLIELDVVRAEEGSLLHFHISYQRSWLSSMLTNAYLSTLGRNKIGFSHSTQEGESRPVQGIKGIIERNAMRYQIAINAFLNTQSLPEVMRHEAALANWFKQNDSHPEQLHEMDEADYMEIKREEWNNQQRLQKALNITLRMATAPHE